MRKRVVAAILPLGLAAVVPAAAYDVQIGRFLHPGDQPAESSAVFRILVGENGRVTGCIATRSSGSAELDDATCLYLLRQGGMGRRRDAQGHRISYEESLEIFREFLNRVPAAH